METRGKKLVAMALQNLLKNPVNGTEPAKQKYGKSNDRETSIWDVPVLPSTSGINMFQASSTTTTHENHSDSESDNDLFGSFDDSDADPDFTVNHERSSERDVANSTSDSLKSITEIAHEIENNIMDIDESNSMDSNQTPNDNVVLSNESEMSSESSMDHQIATTSTYQIRKQIKLKRNMGKSYITGSKKTVKERVWKPLPECRKKCKDTISLEDQKHVFERYWTMNSYNARVLYVCGLMRVSGVKSRTVQNPSKMRNRTCAYHVDVHGKSFEVCQKCFLTIHGETDNFLKSVMKKKSNSGEIPYLCDQRGKTSPGNKLSDRQICEIKEHINSFPSYVSHYSRRHTNQKYFETDLTITKLYKLYTEKCTNAVGITKFTSVFKEMGIKFKRPQLDTCNKCNTLNGKIINANTEEAKLQATAELDAHHIEADSAYNMKKADKAIAKLDSSVKVYAFDLEQCLPTPFLRTNISFYKRPLWTYNLTVHDLATNDPYCFMWHEALAGRGANEIASCLLTHLQQIPDNANHVILYSDSCGGQNKNTIVSTMLAILATTSSIRVIDHKFMTPGHTHMECDLDHAQIEKKKKRTSMPIHHPREWYNFVGSVGNRHEFKVVEMPQSSFKDFANVSKTKMTWRKKDAAGNKFDWRRVKWIRYTEKFGQVLYKTSLSDEEGFKTLLIGKRGIDVIDLNDVAVKYTAPLKITEEKKKDLLEMLPLISPEYHSFYMNLNIDPELLNTHPDIFSDSEDE